MAVTACVGSPVMTVGGKSDPGVVERGRMVERERERDEDKGKVIV
jgi:hypothetical protein